MSLVTQYFSLYNYLYPILVRNLTSCLSCFAETRKKNKAKACLSWQSQMHRTEVAFWIWNTLCSTCTSLPQPCTCWAHHAKMTAWFWTVLDSKGRRWRGLQGCATILGPMARGVGPAVEELKKRELSECLQRDNRNPDLSFSWSFCETVLNALLLWFILLLIVWDLSGHHITHCGSDPGLVTLGVISAIFWLLVRKWISVS